MTATKPLLPTQIRHIRQQERVAKARAKVALVVAQEGEHSWAARAAKLKLATTESDLMAMELTQ